MSRGWKHYRTRGRIIGFAALLACLFGVAGSAGVVAAKTAPPPRFTVTPINHTGLIVGQSFTTNVFTFKDTTPGPSTTYTAAINWGDGSSPSAGTITGGPTYTVSGTHTYSAQDTYLAKVTITPSDGAAYASPKTASLTAKIGPPAMRFNVLVVRTSDTDPAANAGVDAIRDAGQTPSGVGNFFVLAPDAADVGDQFTAQKLEKFRSVIFLDTGTGSGLTQDQKDAFEEYFHSGGGAVFIGSAIQTDPSWQFLTDLLGARAGTTLASSSIATANNIKVAATSGFASGQVITLDSGANSETATITTVGTAGAAGTGITVSAPLTKDHALGSGAALPKPANQTGTVKVYDRVHDATKNLPEYWNRNDGWFNYTSNVRGFSHVLDTVVVDPFNPQPQGAVLDGISGSTMGFDHPVSWCKDYKGGRSFYTSLGQTAAGFDAGLTKHLQGAINWSAGVSDVHYSDCGATVLANYQQVSLIQPNLSEPIGFDQLPDGRIIQTDRRGGVHLHNFADGSSRIIANIPVYTQSEDGLYGGAVDNNFATNHWVYLYYAPPNVDNITYSDGTTGHTNNFDVASGRSNSAAPTQAVNISDYDSWIGYFQLSRFKFVDGANPTLDLASEQQIMRVTVSRGACCHVAGDIDFDKHGNLYLPTGDDSAAGSGDAGNFSQSIDQRTDENQTVRLTNATGGTFTLTFNGQTTGPLAFNATAAQIQTALEGLSNIGVGNIRATGGPVNTANVLVTWKGTFEEQDVATLTSNSTALTGTTPTITVGVGVAAAGSNTTARQGGLWRMPAADSNRSAMNTNDLRGKVNRIHVKDTFTAADSNKADFGSGVGSYTIPSGNLFPLVAGGPQVKTRPEIYAMGFRNPFRLQVDENDVVYVSDYSSDNQVPAQFHGSPGVGRYEIVRHAANYGWPECYGPAIPQYPWNVNLGVPMNLNNHQPVPAGTTPTPYDCANPAGVPNNDYWNLNGGPSVEAGRAVTPPLTQADIWYSYRDNNAATPLGTPCWTNYGPDALTAPAAPGSTTACPRLFPELYTGGVGPHGIAKYHYDPANPNALKFPPYYDNHVFLGEFTQDTLRDVSLDSNNNVFKITKLLDCGQRPNTAFTFECDNPMDMQFGADGDFYLLTYGDGFFNINPDAGMYKWQYVKGQRAPTVGMSADRTDGSVPLTVNFSSAGTSDADPGDSITYDWDFGDGTAHSLDPNPTHVYTAHGRYTVHLVVTDSSGKSAGQQMTITAGNTSPTVTVTTPVAGGTFTFGNDIPYTVTVTDPEDGTIPCVNANIAVTFVLGHDTHGHAEGGTTGCSGVLHTVLGDESHGGNVFGVISATYTDHGDPALGGANTLATTSQQQIRQKHQEVEFAVSQSGTNTATDTDGPPPGSAGTHRGSLAAGDWIQLNGPFNLVNISSITYRVADTATRTPGTPMAAIEIHQDTLTGPIVQTDNLLSTGNAATWTSQNFPISLSGTHELFLVFRAVTGGQTGANLFNLNWLEFQGAGIGTTP